MTAPTVTDLLDLLRDVRDQLGHELGHCEGSLLPRINAALSVSPEDPERWIGNIVRARMAHYGYTPDEIAKAERNEADMVTMKHFDETAEWAVWLEDHLRARPAPVPAAPAEPGETTQQEAAQ